MKHRNILALLAIFPSSLFSLISQSQAEMRLQAHLLSPSVTSVERSCGAAARMVTPLVIDLDGDGVETISLKADAHFDYDGNGFAEQTGWASPDDGILVSDKNGNGKIDSGKELFGSYAILRNGQKAENGFQALAEYDRNNDGMVSPMDRDTWNTLIVWKDSDGDGYSSPKELHTLKELGIISISTSYTEATIEDSSGNDHRELGSVTTKDGLTRAMDDVWVQIDRMNTIPNEWLIVPSDILQMPDIKGYGNVYSLHQAMTRDTKGKLKSLIRSFMITKDISARNNLMTKILEVWAGAETVSRASSGPHMNGRQLAILEKFYGEPFFQEREKGGNPSPDTTRRLQQAYNNLFETYYASLMSRTHLSQLFDKISYTKDKKTGECKGNMNAIAVELLNRIAANPSEGKKLLSEFVRAIKGSRKMEILGFPDFQSAFKGKPDLLLIIETAGRVSESNTEKP